MNSLIFLIILLFSNTFSINLERAANFLKENAGANSTGNCAKFVADALETGGFVFQRQPSAYLYMNNSILLKIGYIEINKPNSYEIGDITVTERNSNHIHGHIAMWCGNNWISDFIQNSEYVYKNNQPPIHYFRYQSSSKTILTSYYSCKNSNPDKCSNVIVTEREFRNWKCAKVDNYCTYIPENLETKRVFEKLSKGEDKEIAAKNYDKFLSGSYGSFSLEDTQIINRQNTCSYISFGDFQRTPSMKYTGVNDKNLCFNAETFSDLKGLVNCGYAEVLFNVRGQIKTINLCSYVPTKNINGDLLPYFKYRFIEKITMDDLEEIIEDGLIGRILQDIEEEEISYDISIEDKNGRKVKFTDRSYETQLISEGKDEDSLVNNQEEENSVKNIFINKFLLFFVLSIL